MSHAMLVIAYARQESTKNKKPLGQITFAGMFKGSNKNPISRTSIANSLNASSLIVQAFQFKNEHMLAVLG